MPKASPRVVLGVLTIATCSAEAQAQAKRPGGLTTADRRRADRHQLAGRIAGRPAGARSGHDDHRFPARRRPGPRPGRLNRYAGPFASRGDKVTLGILRQSRQPCTAAETAQQQQLIDMLHRAWRAEIADGVLVLYDRQGQEIRFVERPGRPSPVPLRSDQPRPRRAPGAARLLLGVGLLMAACSTPDPTARCRWRAAGTSWRAETIAGRPVQGGTVSTLSFLADGRVAGSGGCNRYAGEIRSEDGRLQVGQLASTMMACLPEQMDQERRSWRRWRGPAGVARDGESFSCSRARRVRRRPGSAPDRRRPAEPGRS